MSTTLRVLHSHPVWLPLTQTWMHTLLRPDVSRVDNHVVCERLENQDQFSLPDITVLSLRYPVRYTAEFLLRRARLIRQLPLYSRVIAQVNPDILHSHFGPFGWLDISAAARGSIPHVVSFYGADATRFPHENPVWTKRYRELFENCAAVLCEGPHMVKTLAALGCSPGKLRIQHIGVDLNKIPFAPRSWVAGTPLHVLIASSFRPKKGIPVALRALAALKGVDLAITVVGDAPAGEEGRREKERIYATARETGLWDRIRWRGFCTHDELFATVADAHLFLHPSVHASNGDAEGGAPVVLIEMAAAGMPIVSTVHCDIPEVIRDGKTGFLAKENDAAHLAQCIRAWIEAPDKWLDRLTASRRHVEEQFDLVKQAESIETIYESCVTREKN